MKRIIGLAALLALPSVQAHAASPAPKGADTKLSSLIKRYRGAKGQSYETQKHIEHLQDSYSSLFSNYGHGAELLDAMNAAGSRQATIDKKVPAPTLGKGWLSKWSNADKTAEHTRDVKRVGAKIDDATAALTSIATGIPGGHGKRLVADPYQKGWSSKGFGAAFGKAMTRYELTSGKGERQRWLTAVNYSLTKQLKAGRAAVVAHLEKAPVTELATELMKLHGEIISLSSGVEELARTDFAEKGQASTKSGSIEISKKPLFMPRTTTHEGGSDTTFSSSGSVEVKQVSSIALHMEGKDGSGNYLAGKDPIESRLFLEKVIRIGDIYGAILKRDPKVATELQHLVKPELKISKGNYKQESFRIDMAKSKLIEPRGLGDVLGPERVQMLREQLDAELTTL